MHKIYVYTYLLKFIKINKFNDSIYKKMSLVFIITNNNLKKFQYLLINIF
jgi:hypothetical protein